MYDLECISPWLKLQPTCPLDRVDLLARKDRDRNKKVEIEKGEKKDWEEDEEEEWDEFYG